MTLQSYTASEKAGGTEDKMQHQLEEKCKTKTCVITWLEDFWHKVTIGINVFSYAILSINEDGL